MKGLYLLLISGFCALCSVVIAGKRTCAQCSNNEKVSSDIEVYYQGDACDCPKNLPYEVKVPKQSKCEEKYDLEYNIQVPPMHSVYRPLRKHNFRIEEPKAADPRILYSHNYQLDVPEIHPEYISSRKHDVRIEQPKPEGCTEKLQGLRTHIDRAVYQQQDCDRACRDLTTRFLRHLTYNKNGGRRKKREAPIFQGDMEDSLLRANGQVLQKENYKRMRRQKHSELVGRTNGGCPSAGSCGYSFETCKSCDQNDQHCSTCYKCSCEPFAASNGHSNSNGNHLQVNQDYIKNMVNSNILNDENGPMVGQELDTETEGYVGLPQDQYYNEIKNILDNYKDFDTKYGSHALSATPEEQRRMIKELLVQLYNSKMSTSPAESASNINANIMELTSEPETRTEAIKPRYKLLEEALNVMRKIQSNTLIPPLDLTSNRKLLNVTGSAAKNKRDDVGKIMSAGAGKHKILFDKKFEIFKLDPVVPKPNAKRSDSQPLLHRANKFKLK